MELLEINTDFSALDVPPEQVEASTYDAAFFGCGHEERCTFLPKKLDSRQLESSYALTHTTADSPGSAQMQNRSFFEDDFGAEIVEMGSLGETEESEATFYERCRSIDLRGDTRILVDYSSMSRLWYNGILTWAESALQQTLLETSESLESTPESAEIEIDFAYAVGDYQGEFTPLTVGEIAPLPGRDASHLSQEDSLAVFGLGYDPIVVESVHERIEPDRVSAFLASPGAATDAVEKVKEKNAAFIEDYVGSDPLGLPLRKVARTAAYLREIVLPYLEEMYVLLIPLGPKPHVLASLLLCMQHPKLISCLRVKGKRTELVNVAAQGDVAVTRVKMRAARQGEEDNPLA